LKRLKPKKNKEMMKCLIVTIKKKRKSLNNYKEWKELKL